MDIFYKLFYKNKNNPLKRNW